MLPHALRMLRPARATSGPTLPTLPTTAAAAAAARRRQRLRLRHYTTPIGDAALALPRTEVTRLPCCGGLTVATECHPALDTATVGLWIDAGSRAETVQNNGVAHFLEHLLFKGTATRSQAALEREVENMGAQLNAYTSREHTVYYARLFARDVPRGIELISDLINKPLLDAKAIESERAVILRELEEIENNMEETVFDHLHATAFPRSSLGMTILGPRANIMSNDGSGSALTRADLVSFIEAKYTAPRMALVAVGNVDHEQVCELAKRANFRRDAVSSSSSSLLLPSAAASAAGGSSSSSPSSAPDFVGSEVRIRVDEMPTAHIAIAVQGCGWDSPDFWPLQVASAMVGSYDRLSTFPATTALAQRIGEAGVADSYTAFNTTYSDTGLFGAYATTSRRSHVEELALMMLHAWTSLSVAPARGEFERAKRLLRAQALLRLDGTTAVAEEIGSQLLSLGRRRSAYEIAQAIDAVSLDDIARVAREYVYDQDPAVVGIGPVEGLPDYNELRSRMTLVRY